MHFKLRKGLDIPLAGAPERIIEDAQPIGSVALLGQDYPGIKPVIRVAKGDKVRLGQAVFHDRSHPELVFVAPGAGVVSDIHLGPRRVLQSVVIDLDGDDEETFEAVAGEHLDRLTSQEIRERLLVSGMWPAFRTRPYSRIPAPDDAAQAIFVPALDTNPLAADPQAIIETYTEDFAGGLRVLAALTEGKVHVCTKAGGDVLTPQHKQIVRTEFSGPHPSGAVGTHIHFLEPVSATKTVWHVNYQDVIAIGRLFTTGRLMTERVVAIGGPIVKRPRLLRTRLGASTRGLLAGELISGAARIVSGSVLAGHRASHWAAYLGRYHLQVSVVAEGGERELFGWAMPGRKKFSAVRAYAGHLFRRPFHLTSALNGSPRAMVPIGNFERVMPLDILPAPLLKALLVGDTDAARSLGCLELDEEDLALCSFVCSGKYEYGPFLRETLNNIEKYG